MAQSTAGQFEYFKGDAINPALVTTWAQEWADKFYPKKDGWQPDKFSGKKDARQKSSKPINSAQLRRFYGDVKNLEMRWENSQDKEKAFRDILPMIKLLKAKAAYANKRDLVPESFKNWIWENVDMINEIKDFKAFLLFFEAVVGFCYGNGLGDNG